MAPLLTQLPSAGWVSVGPWVGASRDLTQPPQYRHGVTTYVVVRHGCVLVEDSSGFSADVSQGMIAAVPSGLTVRIQPYGDSARGAQLLLANTALTSSWLNPPLHAGFLTTADEGVPAGSEVASIGDAGIAIGSSEAGIFFGGEPLTTPFILWDGILAASDEELRRFCRTAPVRPLKPRLNRPWRKHEH